MLDTINEQLDYLKFSSYLEYILSKSENKTLEYISPSGDLYKLLLFEDILRIDFKDKCKVNIDLDVDYIGTWWSENILPLFKAKYNKEDLDDVINNISTYMNDYNIKYIDNTIFLRIEVLFLQPLIRISFFLSF